MKRRAVIVGVDKYQHEDIVDLRHAVDDAYELKAFFGALPGHCAFESVRVLREPTDAAVQKAVRESLDGLGAGDLFLFYFSGHGIQQRESKQHLLLCPEAHPEVLEYGTNGTVPHYFLDQQAKKHACDFLLIFDACRNELLVSQL